MEPDSQRIVIDATIQQFECTFELFWETLKRCLNEEGIDVKTPRESLQRAFQVGWIDDEAYWIQMCMIAMTCPISITKVKRGRSINIFKIMRAFFIESMKSLKDSY